MFRRPSSNNATPMGRRTPSLDVPNQTQIEDLVQRNRTLEQTNRKLTEQLNLEQQRAKDAVTEIQKQLVHEQREWREGCDVLVSCHRLAHLRTIANLEAVRSKVLDEEEATRREKVQRLQRDVKIIMFQIRESELEDKITELEDEREDIVAQHEEAVANLRRKISALVAERKKKAAELTLSEKERDQVQDKLSELRQEHVMLRSSAESNVIKLERVTLQLEGAQTKSAELERTNDELKRGNTDLQRQLEKWQDLETKGNGELETLRKQKMALEVKASTLQDRFDQLSTEKDKESQKAVTREERFRKLVKDWQDEAEEQRSQREHASQVLGEAHKRTQQLEAELEIALNAGTSGGDKRDEGSLFDPSATASRSQPTTVRPRSPHRTKTGKRTKAEHDPGIPDSSELQGKEKCKRTKLKLSPVSEVEETNAPKPRGAAKKLSEDGSNPKNTLKKGKGKAKVTQDDTATNDDAEQNIKISPRAANKVKRRRKVPASDEDEVQILGSNTATVKKDAQQKRRPGKQKRDGEVQKNRSDVSSTEESDIAKERGPAKKRKINIFSNPAEPTFAFANNDIDFGLNIPTTLSPVKETTTIPGRSTSVMSRIMSKGKLR